MKKKFTLIELIVVITIIAILATIVIPNISNITGKGEGVAIVSNVRNLQTISDLYAMDNNGALPTIAPPKIELPEPIDFVKLYPKYEKNLPKTKRAKYWIDVTGTVWGSEADGPAGFNYNESTQQISWSPRSDAVAYQVFEIVGYTPTATSVDASKIKYKEVGDPVTETHFQGEPGKAYAVSSIDDKGNLSAPIGSGLYVEYVDTLESAKKGQSGNTNRPPVARITVLPSTNVDTETVLTWSHEESYDPDGDEIVNVEWKNKQDIYPVEGMYPVELRVQDSKGNWSEWTTVIINVSRKDTIPVANFTYSPTSGITNEMDITFDPSGSYDSDGDSIVAYHWKIENESETLFDEVTLVPPNGKYPAGSIKVMLRVQDSRGNWSEWVEQIISIAVANKVPTVTISRNPSGAVDSNTNITFTANYSDPDGDAQDGIEWRVDGNIVSNPNGKFSAGTHKVEVRVKDARGAWSEWAEMTFTVDQANNPPTVTISRNPSSGTLYSNTNITFTANYSDPDGDAQSGIEWRVDGNIVSNPNGAFAAGTHKVEVRVKDAKGAWSEWAEMTFVVEAANQPPTAAISISPSQPNTAVETTFTYINYNDPDGDPIGGVQWQLDNGSITSTPPNGMLSAGSHTIKMRVKDSKGNWSEWYTQTFTVANNFAPLDPNLYQQTYTPRSGDNVVFNYYSTIDPDGDAIVKAEWKIEDYDTGQIIYSGTLNTPNGTFSGILYVPSGANFKYYIASVRVQDARGAWSNWKSISVYVSPGVTIPQSCNIDSTRSMYWYTTLNKVQYRTYGFHLTSWDTNWSWDYDFEFTIDGVKYNFAHDFGVNVFWIYYAPVNGNGYFTVKMKSKATGATVCTGSGYVTWYNQPA